MGQNLKLTYTNGEVAYQLNASVLTNTGEKYSELDFDLRNSLFVFHNGKEVDREMLQLMQKEATNQHYTGWLGLKALWGRVLGIVGKRTFDMQAKLIAVKRGKIYFDQHVFTCPSLENKTADSVDGIVSSDSLYVGAETEVSITVADVEKFILNVLRKTHSIDGEKEIEYFDAKDIYRDVVKNILRRALQIFADTHTASELHNCDCGMEIQNIINSNGLISKRLSEFGIELSVENVRFLSEDQIEIIQAMRGAKKNLRDHQFELEKTREDNKFERDKDQLNKDNEFAKGQNEFAQAQRMNPLEADTHKLNADHSVSIRSTTAERKARLRAIAQLVLKDRLKTAEEIAWFKKELERQGLLKTEEYDKLNDDLERIRRDRKWDAEDTDTKHTWDNEELKARHESFMKALGAALGLDEATAQKALDDFKRAEAIVNQDHLHVQEDKEQEHDLGQKRKADAYADERDEHNFGKKVRDDDYARDKKSKDAAVDFCIDKTKTDYADERDRSKRSFDEDIEDRRAQRDENSASNAFSRQQENLKALQEQEFRMAEQNRQTKKDELLADLEGKRSDNEREIAIANSADRVGRAESNAVLELLMKQKQEQEAKEERERMQRLEEERIKWERERIAQEDVRKHEAYMASLNQQNLKQQAQAQEYDKIREHEENMAKIQSGADVANARSEEKDNTISHLSGKDAVQKEMVCDKCNRYFPNDYAVCPLCGGKLRKVEL